MSNAVQQSQDIDPVRVALVRRKAAVETYLQRFFEAKLEEAGPIAPEIRQLLEFLRQFTLSGGKRIRAALVAAGYLCRAPEPPGDLLTAAGAAVELLHAFLLTHDDVIDRDSTRHGVPTMHQRFADDLARRYPSADAPRYGNSLAVIAGDVAGMLAYDLLATVAAPADHVLAALRVLSRTAQETGYGEALDVLAELEPRGDEARVLLIHRYKTAKYSIEGPLHIGAILAGAPAAQLAALSAFAIPLGIAYQLQDDYLGAFGSETATGKPVGADLREGKRTLLSVHGLQGPYAAHLGELIGNRALDGAGVQRAQEYLRQGGSAAYSEERTARLHEAALDALDHLPAREEARAFLRGLVTVLMNRAE